MPLTRREVIGGFLAVAGATTLRSFGQITGGREPRRLETFSQWLRASRDERKAALQSCLDRIRAEDPAIHAWKQVSPQRPTGDGPLAEIPFGVKDIIET